MIKINEAVIVEGKYDKIKLSGILDALIIVTDGFRIFKDREKLALLRRLAKEQGLITVQRFFALDSKGMESIEEMLRNTNPHLMEIMPGVIGKAITRFRKSGIPVIGRRNCWSSWKIAILPRNTFFT